MMAMGTKSTSREEKKNSVHAMQGIKFQVTFGSSFLFLTQPNV
jgi:hypothetical protein